MDFPFLNNKIDIFFGLETALINLFLQLLPLYNEKVRTIHLTSLELNAAIVSILFKDLTVYKRKAFIFMVRQINIESEVCNSVLSSKY